MSKPTLVPYWDAEITLLVESGMPLQEATDRVVRFYLKRGDTLAFTEKLADGYVPGAMVMIYLSWMLAGDDLDAARHKEVPFILQVKSRSGKRASVKAPSLVTRDRFLAAQVKLLRKQMSYEAAVENVREQWSEGGVAVGEQTIRDAHDKIYGKRSRQ